MIHSPETSHDALPSVDQQPSRALIVRAVEEEASTRTGEILEEAKLIEDAQFLLDNSPESTLKYSLSPKSRATLNAAIAYLKAPTGNQADIKKLGFALGGLWFEEKHIPVVRNLNRRFINLQYAHHMSALQEALNTDPQEMMKIAETLSTLRGLTEQGLKLPNELSTDSPLRRDFEDFSDKNEMRLRRESKMPVISFADSTSVITGVEEFLQTGEHDVIIDRALAYLKAPTGNAKDLKKIGYDMGELICMTYMGEGPPALEALNTHILRLQFEHEFTKLQAAIAREPQDMKEVTASLVLARDVASSSKSVDLTQLHEFEEFLKNFEIGTKSIEVK